MYKIVRMYAKGGHRTIKTGLTLEQAQEHCRDPETNSKTCTKVGRKRLTHVYGPWFDGYEECRR